MSGYVFVSFESCGELARVAAKRCLDSIPANSPIRLFTLAFSGGRIAKQCFTALAREAQRRAWNLNTVHFFWADERCVPPTDPESNFRIANELLFAPLRISAERIHRIRGELAPDLAASEATAELSRIASVNESGHPVLDLVLLGMGEDGHVASLFPDEPLEIVNHPAVYRAVVASKLPPHRVTLGYGVIAAAREVWVLASGAGKEATLKESLRTDGNTPLARVLRMRSRTEIFTDISLA